MALFASALATANHKSPRDETTPICLKQFCFVANCVPCEALREVGRAPTFIIGT